MKVTTSDHYTFELSRLDGEYIQVESTPEGIESLLDTITLTGTQEVPVSDEYRSSGVQVLHDQNGPSDQRIALREGTVAMWLSFEALNYL